MSICLHKNYRIIYYWSVIAYSSGPIDPHLSIAGVARGISSTESGSQVYSWEQLSACLSLQLSFSPLVASPSELMSSYRLLSSIYLPPSLSSLLPYTVASNLHIQTSNNWWGLWVLRLLQSVPFSGSAWFCVALSLRCGDRLWSYESTFGGKALLLTGIVSPARSWPFHWSSHGFCRGPVWMLWCLQWVKWWLQPVSW